MRVILSLVLMLGGRVGLCAAENAEEKAVVATVQRLFDAMAAHDGAAMKTLLMPDSRAFAVREGQGITSGTHAEFIERIAASKDALLERMWDAKVMVRGAIATLWAPYDFHRNGEFSHCGVDAVSLVKAEGGWKIASIVYTAEKTGCAPSPLGAVK